MVISNNELEELGDEDSSNANSFITSSSSSISNQLLRGGPDYSGIGGTDHGARKARGTDRLQSIAT